MHQRRVGFISHHLSCNIFRVAIEIAKGQFFIIYRTKGTESKREMPSKKKPQKREDSLIGSTYKIIVVGGGGVGKQTLSSVSLQPSADSWILNGT